MEPSAGQHNFTRVCVEQLRAHNGQCVERQQYIARDSGGDAGKKAGGLMQQVESGRRPGARRVPVRSAARLRAGRRAERCEPRGARRLRVSAGLVLLRLLVRLARAAAPTARASVPRAHLLAHARHRTRRRHFARALLAHRICPVRLELDVGL